MANKKISELPLINTLSGSNSGGTVIPVVVGGTTAQISAENFSKFTNLYAAQTGSANIFTANQTINANLSVSGNTTIGGTLVVAGRLTAEEFHTEITTASVIYSSGSTKFGDDSGDRHEFTGSIYAKDSIIIGTEVLGNAGVNAFTASANSQLSRIYQATASLQQATSSLQAHSASVNAQLERLQQTTQSLQVATASLQAFSSSVNSQLERVYQTTQSLHVATASLQAHSASVDSQLLRLQQTTQSLHVATASLQAFSSSVNDQLQRVYQTTQSLHVATASLQQFTASQDSRNFTISQITASFAGEIGGLEAYSASLKAAAIVSSSTQIQNYDVFALNSNLYNGTGSIKSEVAGIEAYTASLKAQAIVSSSTQVQNYDVFALNSNLYTSTGSLIGITNGLMAFTASLDNTYATDAQLYQLYQTTRSLELHSGSMIGITNGLMAFTSSLRNEVNGIESYTSSLKAAISVSGTNVQIIGDLNVNKLNVQYVSSSVLVTSGSNIFGDQSTDKHEFTGSVGVTGNLVGASNIQANKFVFTDGVVAQNVGGQNIIGTSGNILYLYTGNSGLYINNQANNAQNVTITDAGVVTTRGGVQIGSSGNDQNLVFGGTNSSIYWGVGGPARMYYNVGDIKISSNGATDVLTVKNIGGVEISGGITGSLMATNGVISGSGLTNYVPIYNGTTALSSSIIFQSTGSLATVGKAITIGSDVAMYKFAVNPIANTYFGIGYTDADSIFMTAVDNTYLPKPIVYSAQSYKWYATSLASTYELGMVIQSSSLNVGFGGIENPLHKVDISGSARVSNGMTISGSVLVSGSIIPNTNGSSFTSSFSLGSSTNAWGDIWVGNGSVKFVNPSSGATASIALDANNQLSLENSSFTKGLKVTGSVNITGTGVNAYTYLQGNAGSGGSTSPAYAQGMALSWNSSNGDGESRLTFSNSGGGTSPRFGIWYNDNSVYREVFRAFANSVATSGSFDVGYGLANDGGARQLTVYGSKSTAQTSVASLNLTQLWNAVSYPVVLEAQQGSLYGNAATDFVLKTSYYSGGVNTIQRMRVTDSGETQITGSLKVQGGITTTSTNTLNGGSTYLSSTYLGQATFFRTDVIGAVNYGGSTIRIAGDTGTSAAGIQFGDVSTNTTGARGRIGFVASANNGNPKEFAIIKGVLDSTGANTCNGSLTFHTLNGDNGTEAAVRMTIDGSGNIGAASGTNIYNASDARLKQNISSISGSLDSVLALNPVKFNWVDDFVPSENGKDMLGFVAQEVQTIVPEAVESFGANSIFVGETEIDNPLRVNEKFLIPVLTKAIQEQQAIIDSLIARIEALENN